MRLINATTWAIEDHPNHVTPPYAILSHTWGSEEVTLKDMETGEWLTRADKQEGREKIQGCCAAAATEGYEYVWIDTCCIDKTSSAELSEAINSMFRWYHESAICFAYLSDVRSAQDPTKNPSDFAKSRWFTRGFTLQELLAPKEIVFVGRDWGEFGTKQTLQEVIASITRIDKNALADRSFEKYSVAQKMSWAAGRQTSRLEDQAYCLLGLFDVNMPLLYGEGERAFIRLQEEIMKRTDDESIFAWSNPPELQTHVQLTGLLASSPSDFSDSSNVFLKTHDSRARYVNPFELVRQHVRVRLPALGPLKGVELSSSDAEPRIWNVVNAERTDDEDVRQRKIFDKATRYLLRPQQISDDQPSSKRRRVGEAEDVNWVAGLAAPTFRLDRFDGSSSLDVATEDDDQEAQNKKLVKNENKGSKDKTTWRWYIYAPVLVIPLMCSVEGKALGILLTRGSSRSKEENILYRLHSPSLVCIEDVSDFIHMGTPQSSLYVYANAKYQQSEVQHLQHVSLEVRIASLMDKGYRMLAEQGGDWSFEKRNKKLVKFQDRQQSRNSIAIFEHSSNDPKAHPSFFLVMDLKEPYIGVLGGSQIPTLGQDVWRVEWGGQSRAEIFLGGAGGQYIVLKVRNLEKVKYLSLSIEQHASYLTRAKVKPVQHGLAGLNLRLQRMWIMAMGEDEQNELTLKLVGQGVPRAFIDSRRPTPTEPPPCLPHSPAVDD